MGKVEVEEDIETCKNFSSLCLYHICKHHIGHRTSCGQAQRLNRGGLQSYRAKALDTGKPLIGAIGVISLPQ